MLPKCGSEGHLRYFGPMRLWMPIVVLLLAACATQRLRKEQAGWLESFGKIAPPGTIQLNDTLFYDRTELTNISWLEYEFWVKSVFGAESPEHLATLPDTTVWSTLVAYGEPYMKNYLRHPAYWEYPVVGITWQQAVAYSKWRSDRVMELSLIRAGIIDFDEDQTAHDHFTIERFYSSDSLSAYHHLPYPSYSIPTFEEWLLAVAMSDSLERTDLRRCKQRRWDAHPGGVEDDRFIIMSRDNSPHGVEPIAAASALYCERGLIWQLRGNVAELCADSTLVLGGGWNDPLDTILLDKPLPSTAPDAATGFRNVCRWRHWDGVRR